MNEIEVVLFEKNILWFEKYSDENLDTEMDFEMEGENGSGDASSMLKIGSLYDYATLPDNRREFYSDISVKLPHMASVMIRMQFNVIAEVFHWDYLFTVENIKPILTMSIDSALKEFRYICIKQDVDLAPKMKTTDPQVPEELIDQLCENTVEEYFTHRKPYDTANALAMSEIEISCPPTDPVNITLNLTFLVMEQILFNHHGFNRRHNREVFFEIVPEMKFNSLRMKCIQIMKHKVDLTVVDLHYFLICMDCAIQTALGDKGHLLTQVMEERGANSDVQNLWYKNASELIKACRGSVETSIKRAEKFDWSKMIR
jgi:hypothetical protein